jgi:hypothetical protein
MIESFVRFFDKSGSDMNLGPVDNSVFSLYSGSKVTYESFEGKLFFPKVSTNLIESQNLYLLQEVTGPSTKFELRRVQGTVTTIGGNPLITGVNTDFTLLSVGSTLKIKDNDYVVTTIVDENNMLVSPTPAQSFTTTDIYYYDFLSYSQLRSSPGTSAERLVVKFPEKELNTKEINFVQSPFFVYDVNYSEEVPFIEKGIVASYDLTNGSSDIIDPVTGRIQLASVSTLPLQLNVGIQASLEHIYENTLEINLEKDYTYTLSQAPNLSGDYDYFFVNGNSNPFFDISQFTLVGPGTSSLLKVVAIGTTGTDTYVKVQKVDNPVTATNYSSYSIKCTNTFKLANLDLYGEVEGEDERLRIVLQNFGKKIDYDNEYIFRDSDIKEELPDYRLLNKKRKELLLEGDNIYPYLGSYKALINIINYFGYYDVRIKEYFLNVDQESSNYGNYMHVLVPKDAKQREEVKAAWRVVPSTIYKKTSLFGLFYDLNKATDEEDQYGIPEVVDAFDFSPEEVLIKLFGLKELLKKEYLPLNARIYDITGEGIYFERIRIDAWADNLHHLVLDLGKRPEFTVLPSEPYISDIRRMDNFYINKFIEQGLTGFVGATALDPSITAGYTGPVSSLFSTYLDTYDNYIDDIYDEKGNLLPAVDPSWQYMPPGILNPDYNLIAARMQPLPDDKGIVAGAPLLLESLFNLSWEESYFNWSQLSILGPSGSPLNINIWTWDSVGRGEYIDMRWTVQKHGDNGFYYDSGRRPIDSFVQETRGATAFSMEGKLSVDMLNGSVANVNILQGYGYTASPTVFIPGPGTYDSLNSYSSGATITSLNTAGLGVGMIMTVTGGIGFFAPGTTVISVDSSTTFTVSTPPPTPLVDADIQGTGATAVITLSVNEGYISGATWSGGYGYSYTPTVVVSPPPTIYEAQNKILHAVAVPYDGEYDIALYNYDITNNYTVEFQKCYVSNKKANFLGVSRIETPERKWEEFHHISWKEVTGPWYYPIHVTTFWGDANISWESLDYISFMNQSLFEYPMSNQIDRIDRDTRLISVDGNLSGQLSTSFTLNVGDSIFFLREESDPIFTNLKILPDQIDSRLKGLVGLTATNALLTGTIGSTSINTGVYNTTSLLSTGDNLWVDDNWYKVSSVGATSIEITTPLVTTFASQPSIYYKSTYEVVTSYTGSFSEMKRFSRIVVSDNCDYFSIDPTSNFYEYVDGLTASGSSITFTEDDAVLRKVLIANSSIGDNKALYMSWGVFSGTYSQEITNISYSGGKTHFRVDDPNKELYYVDGNFTLNLSDYDVDYAETKIGAEALTYQYSDELTWDENPTITWGGLDYHGGTLCGFVIPFVSPGGSITIDEEPSFIFTGNVNIQSTKPGLQLAANQLKASENSGIIKYTYEVLPDVELYIKGSTGNDLSFASSSPIGATSIALNAPPSGGALKIPAEISVTITAGSISAVNIINPGYGYSESPLVTIESPCGGTAGTITLFMSGLPFAGTVTGATFSAGSGYTSVPEVNVDSPVGYEPYDNYIWTGYEWIEVTGVSGSNLLLGSSLSYVTTSGFSPMLPYDYHKQLFLNPSVFQQFYYFIHAEAKNPSDEMLSYVNFDNGVQSEWATYPDRTYTYPLRNSILFSSIPQYSELSQDQLYNKWIYEGSDYPPLNIYPDYASDRLSFSSRIPYAGTLQSPFSFIDTVISDKQRSVLQFTPVIFHYDNCMIPGKNSPIWTIKEDGGKIQAISTEEKLMWNFTRPGNFSVSLSIQDSNGNKSDVDKTSFIVVKEFKEQ